MKENKVGKELNNAVRGAMGLPVEDNSPRYIGPGTQAPQTEKRKFGMRVTIRGNTGWLKNYEVVSTYPHRVNAVITTSDGVEIHFYNLHADEIEFVN